MVDLSNHAAFIILAGLCSGLEPSDAVPVPPPIAWAPPLSDVISTFGSLGSELLV